MRGFETYRFGPPRSDGELDDFLRPGRRRSAGDRRERGSALVLVLLVVLVLLGLGLIALRQAQTELATSGSERVTRQAHQAAFAGLQVAAANAMRAPEYFHRQAVSAQPAAPTYTFGAAAGEVAEATDPPGVFTLPSPLAGDEAAVATGDSERLAPLEYRATMSRPRLSTPPVGYQVAGAGVNRFVFYTYQLEVFGWVNRSDGSSNVEPGTSGARQKVCGDLRLGPIPVNQ